MRKKTIAVWFSCGAASAVAAYLTLQKYGHSHEVLIFNNPVAEEDKDNLRFKKDVESWLGESINRDVSIKECFNPKYPMASAEEVWIDRKYMSGVKGAPCTMQLKKEARHQAELKYPIDYHVLGFTIDEKHRHDRFVKYERSNVLPILIDEGLSKNDCFKIIKSHGLELPRVYKVLDNANCIGCVKSTGVDYWQRIRKHYPNVFLERSTLSRELGVRLVKYKGKRIYLDELPICATGRASRRVDCGIFCELPKFKKPKK